LECIGGCGDLIVVGEAFGEWGEIGVCDFVAVVDLS